MRFIRFAVILLLSITAVAQDTVNTGNSTNVGLPENGLFSGSNIDNVQLNNGNLHISIPIVSVPGRNGAISQQFIYDSRGYAASISCEIATCNWIIKWEKSHTTVMVPTMSAAFVGTKSTSINVCDGTRRTVFNNFVIREADGTKHHFIPDDDGNAACTLHFPRYADDGSGWMMVDDHTVISKSGTKINVGFSASPSVYPFENTSTSATDANGNRVTSSTDSLGRTLPSSTQYYDFGGTLRTVGVTTQTIGVDLQQFCGDMTPTSYPTSCSGYNATFTVPHILTLPDGRTYTITYAPDGTHEISSLTLPDGAVISYTYDYYILPGGVREMGGRRVTSRTVTANGVSSTWTYTYYPYVNPGDVDRTKVTSPDGSYTISYCDGATTAPDDGSCHIARTESYSTSGQLLKREDNEFYRNWQTVLPSATTTTTFSSIPGDSTVSKSRVETDYDSISDGSESYSWGNPVEKREFIYDSAGANQQLIRRTHTTYLHQVYPAYLNSNIADRVYDQVTYDGGTAGAAVPFGTSYSGGNQITRTETRYDETPVAAVGVGIPGHDDTYSPGYLTRGNATTSRKWRSTDNQLLASHTTYDELGHARSTTDPLGHTTSFDYSDTGNWASGACNPSANSYAFLTQTTNALGHRSATKYYACTGLPYSKRDENDIAAARAGTTFTYDLLNRPLTVTNNDGGGWIYSYPSGTTINSSQILDPGRTLDRVFTLDGLGRVIQSKITSDGACNPKVDTTYDFAGRVKTVSNPYCSNADATYGVTTNEYDGLGRLTKTIPPDGNPYVNHVRTDFGGNYTVTTDQAGKQRKTFNDPLGRLVRVDEPGPLTSQATASTGSFTISGSEQNHNDPGHQSSGSITLSGTCTGSTRQKKVFDPDGSWHWATDSGSVTLTVNGFGGGGGYASGTSLAQQITNALNGSSSPVTATLVGSTINFTAKAYGPNYSLAISNTWDTSNWSTALCSGSASGSAMTGGIYPIINAYDAGDVNLSVSGYTASVTYGQSSTPATLATALAAVFNGDPQSPVTAIASGSTVTVASKAFGAFANFSISASSNSTQGSFSSPSFTASPSGSALTGGADGAGGLAAPYITLYSYDPLDRLTCVEQHGNVASSTGCSAAESSDSTSSWRIRRFTYDSLGQLLTAKNPESGTITYAYDNDGSLTSKTSPAPNQTGSATLTVTYGYDSVHRLIGKSYSNGEPSVSYSYDQSSYNGLTITNGAGRRTGMSDVSGATAWTYDSMGRATAEQRTIAGVTKTMSHTYYLDSSLASLTYPSGVVVNFTIDGAGRPLSAIDTGNNIHYAEAAAYTAFGAPTAITFGAVSGGFAGYHLNTPLNTFNKRLQPTLIGYDVPGSGTILSRFYTYGPPLQNNGNITAITDNLNADRSAVYTYDQLNRISSAQSTGTDCSVVPTNPAITKNWGNTYTIDAWGNLTAKPVTKCSSETLSTSVNLKNQLGVGTHDSAGNLLNNGSATYTYDAENRIVSTAGATYVYDGDGVRVKKSGGSSAPTLYFGESFTDGPVTETDLSGTIKAEYVFFGGKRIARRDLPAGSVHYYFSDHLKSVNLIYDAAGNKEEDSDFYPYGGERAYLIGSGNHFKFTGKERDPESGLDYFGARYYGNSLGRFITPDVPFADQHRSWPQSWNLYQYSANNPGAILDEDGRALKPAQSASVNRVLRKPQNASIAKAIIASPNYSAAALENEMKHGGNPSPSLIGVSGESVVYDSLQNPSPHGMSAMGYWTEVGFQPSGAAVGSNQPDLVLTHNRTNDPQGPTAVFGGIVGQPGGQLKMAEGTATAYVEVKTSSDYGVMLKGASQAAATAGHIAGQGNAVSLLYVDQKAFQSLSKQQQANIVRAAGNAYVVLFPNLISSALGRAYGLKGQIETAVQIGNK